MTERTKSDLLFLMWFVPYCGLMWFCLPSFPRLRLVGPVCATVAFVVIVVRAIKECLAARRMRMLMLEHGYDQFAKRHDRMDGPC